MFSDAASLDLSVVIPLHNEEACVDALVASLLAVLGGVGTSWEVILVDDGSTDRTVEKARAHAGAEPRIRLLCLARNFGQTAAIAAGFDAARGRVIVTLDGDLQNDPADIPRLLEAIASGSDVVSGWRKDRQDPYLTRVLPSHIANLVISRVTGVALHDYGCTLKAYRREVLADMHLYGEMHRFLPALASWGGWRITEMPVAHKPRTAGVSKYGLGRTFKVLLDVQTVRFLGSHVTNPIHVFGGLGLVCWGLGLLSVGFLGVRKLAFGDSMITSPLLLLSVLLAVLGTQSMFLGLLAEMLVRTYYESQKKPVYRIRERVNEPPEAAAQRARAEAGGQAP